MRKLPAEREQLKGIIMRKIIFFLKIVWRKWEYGKNDPMSFRLDYKTAWKVANIIHG
jgi:hypothetical protein